jgi:hypothetical protein
LKHYATSRKVAGSSPDAVIGFLSVDLILPAEMALCSTQTLTEMSARNLPGGERRSALKADNLTAIIEPTV